MPTPSEGAVPSGLNPLETHTRSTIAASAEAWRELLTQSFDILHDYKDGGTRWARLRDVSGRFNLWASSMGVFAAAVHASLDYRLRDLADVKELILEQLDYMVEGLDRLIVVLDDLETFSGAATDAVDEAQSLPAGLEEIDAILNSISTSIDWLHRLANMIRRASFVRQNERASTFPLKNALGDDLTPVYQKIFHHWIKRDFPNIEDNLCERLASTMILRRRRILYRRSRQAKLSPYIVKPAPKPVKRTLDAPSAITRLSVPDNVSRVAQTPSVVASTQYTATTIDPKRCRRVVSTPSRVSETRTISMTSSDKNFIPPPPRIAPNELEFVCPFCCLILPASNARSGDLWGVHVKKDLDPYICAFFPCEHDEDIFSTSADWVSHEQTHCMRWYCTSKAHATEMFSKQEEYINHMKARHPGKFKEAQLPLLAENSRRPLKRIFDACPLCGEESEKEKGLEDHVAHHLQYLALLSLPPHEDPDDAEYGTSASSMETVARSRTTMQSERHAMPPANFSHDDMFASEAEFLADDAIPDTEDQQQVEIAELWQRIHLRKIRVLNKDLALGREEMRMWLSLADHTVNQQKARDIRQLGYNQWLIQHQQQFVAWKSEPASFLWLYGNPGCGKTVLSSAIIDHLQQDAFTGGSSTNLLYFYFDHLDSGKQSANDAITSLVSQLYFEQPSSQHHLDLLWLSCNGGREPPSAQDIVDTFEKMIEDAGETCLILDALDECQPRDSPVEASLLKWLEDIHSHHQGLHVIVTGRPLAEITKAIGGFATRVDLSEKSHHMEDTPAGKLVDFSQLVEQFKDTSLNELHPGSRYDKDRGVFIQVDSSGKSHHMEDAPAGKPVDFLDNYEAQLFEEFKDTSSKELHSGFTHSNRYDDDRVVFAPLPSGILSSILSEAMLHSRIAADLKYNPQECGWNDVLDCIAIAETSYTDKGKENKVMSRSHNADATADVLNSLASMIPDEKGLGVLRQGLVFIFQAWHTRMKTKEEVLRQLEDLPSLLATAAEKWKLYPRDQSLKIGVRELCETVLDSLSSLIQILLRNQEGSFIKKTMHRIPAIESQRIDEISDTVTRAKSAVQDCVDRIDHERLAKNDELSTRALIDHFIAYAGDPNEKLSALSSAYPSTPANVFPTPVSAAPNPFPEPGPKEYQRVPPLHDLTRTEPDLTPQSTTLPHINIMHATRNNSPIATSQSGANKEYQRVPPLHDLARHNVMMRAIEDIAARHNESRLPDDGNVRDIMKDCFREFIASSMQTEYNMLEEPEPTMGEKIITTKNDLLLHLNLREVGTVVEDVVRIRQQGSNVASDGHELAREIFNMTKFTEWMQQDESRLLLVDGHCKNLGNGKTSPLTVLCEYLASNFAASDSLVILEYYCGHHSLDSNGLPAGPLGLIKSLLAQLLEKPDDVLPQSLQMDKELFDRVKPDDVDNLCEIFAAVFLQINRNKITLCIIDEVAEFEGARGGWNDGMSLVAFQLRWMVHKYQGSRRIKVLMTSADKSAVVSQILEHNDKISLRGSVPPNYSGGRLVMSGGGFSFT